MVEEELRGKQDERLLVRSVHLAAESMEYLCWSSGVHNKEIGMTLCISSHKLDHELVPVILQRHQT